MPRQPPHASRCPYSELLSALRKLELIWLCVEFGLPSSGPVPNLRDWAKHHLSQNADTLYRNPRYRSLYLRVHTLNHPPPPELFFDSMISQPIYAITISSSFLQFMAQHRWSWMTTVLPACRPTRTPPFSWPTFWPSISSSWASTHSPRRPSRPSFPA